MARHLETAQERDSAGRLAAGAAIGVVGGFAARGFQFVTQVILANALAPALLGLFAEGFAVLRLSRLAAVAGLDKGVIRFGTGLWDRHDAGLVVLVRRAFAWVGAFGVSIAVALWWSAPWIAERVMHNAGLVPVLRAFALAVPTAAVVRLAAATTRLGRRAHWGVIVEDLTQPVVGLLVVVALLGWGYGLRAPLYAWPVAYGLAAVVGLGLMVRLLSRHRASRGTTDEVAHRASVPAQRTVLTYSLHASLAVSFTMMTMMVDRLMIGVFRPEDEVGTYHAAAQVAALFPMVVGAFGMIIQPMIVACWQRGDRDRLGELFRAATRWCLYATIPAYVVIARAAPSLLETLFQPAYRAGAVVLVVLASGQMINAATGPVGQVLVMAGRERAWLVCSGTALVVNIVLDVVLIPRFGGLGAAVATAIAITLTFGLGALVAWRRLGVSPYRVKDLGLVVAGVAALAAVAARQAAMPLTGWVGLAVDTLVAVGAAVAVIAAIGFEATEKALARTVLDRLRRSA